MGLGDDFDFSKLGLDEKSMQDAMKMFESSMGGQDGGSDDSNPFMKVCQQMFQDMESKGGPSGDAGNDLPGGTPDDANFMNLLNSLAKDMMKGDSSQQEVAMDKILGEFSSFIKDAEGNEEMKTALESVVE
jgi:hypothetical protein